MILNFTGEASKVCIVQLQSPFAGRASKAPDQRTGSSSCELPDRLANEFGIMGIYIYTRIHLQGFDQ